MYASIEIKNIKNLYSFIYDLFIPSNDFFNNYFSELQNWFSDRLGFLYYPFDFIFDTLNRILNIELQDPMFHIPEIHEPFSDTILIHSTDFYFNSLLENKTFEYVHNIYFIIIDAIIYISLITLLYKKYEEVIKR